MAIKVWPADTQSDQTLMGQILPGPINNRVGYGSLKKPEAGPSRIWVFVIPGLDLTCLNIKLPKTPYIYINKKKPYFLSYSTLSPHPFPSQPHSPLPLSLTDSPSSPFLTHSYSRIQAQALTSVTHRRHHTISLPASSSVTVSLKLCHCQSQDWHKFVSLFLCLLWAPICLLQV